MKILDIHTHHKVPQPEGVVSLRYKGKPVELSRFQAYSIGIHPWDSSLEFDESAIEQLRQIARRPEIVAIGEGGIDLAGKGGALFRQMNVFKVHIELSENLRKPLIIHDVKAHDIIYGLRRDLRPSQNWAIHGFRAKPEVAEMLLRVGCWLSFGENFNRETLLAVPEDRILAETDESSLSIGQIIEKISMVKEKDMTEVIARNSEMFLGRRNEELGIEIRNKNKNKKMGIKGMIMGAMLLTACALQGFSQDVAAQSQSASQEATIESHENWFVNHEFDGLSFQLPGGMQVEKGSAFIAKYPDGTFGVSMEKINKASTKNIAYKLCERLADSMHLPRGGVKKMSFGKAKGAKAEGMIEGMKVTCIVLAYDDHQVQIVAMSTPAHEAWVRHFLETLKK